MVDVLVVLEDALKSYFEIHLPIDQQIYSTQTSYFPFKYKKISLIEE